MVLHVCVLVRTRHTRTRMSRIWFVDCRQEQGCVQRLNPCVLILGELRLRVGCGVSSRTVPSTHLSADAAA